MIDSISDRAGADADLKKERRGKASQQQRPTEDRLPPYSEQAEMGVLGCVLLSPNECLGECIEKMRGKAEVFYDLRHQTIFNVLVEMYEAHTGIDLITLQERLKQRNTLEEIGGIAYLAQLQDSVPSAANLSYYLEIVTEKFRIRKLIAICTDIVGRVYDYEGDVETLLISVESEISKLTEAELPQTEEHIKVVMGRVLKDMEEWHYARGSQQLRGLPTGPPGVYLDKILMGIRDGHYVTLAGRPGDGKSSLAMNVVEFLAKDYVWFEKTGRKVLREEKSEDGEVQQIEVDETRPVTGIPVGVFTIEMDNESLGYRLMFGRAGVDEAEFNQGFAKKGDMKKLIVSAGQLAGTNIYLDDTPGQTIGQIAAKARRMARQYGIKLFVLDYLQLCESENPRDDERTMLKKISKKIMSLKKQLKVPWLVLAQMNRNIETSERDRQPLLSDLAGSGSIEQDSDKVLILKKTPRKEVEKEPEGGGISDAEKIDQICGDWEWSRRPRRVDVWVVKNRRGPTGKAEMIFQNNLCRFVDAHQFFTQHGVEQRKEGESKHFGVKPDDLPSNEELNIK
jgi:replicative DNA helicase